MSSAETPVLISGPLAAAFAATTRAFRDGLRREGGGASLAVFHHGALAVEVTGGTAGDGRAWTPETLVMCQSATKGVLATVAHRLTSHGLLDVDAPVAAYWPEFGQHGKADLLVRHVLTHSAGLQKMRARTKSLDEIYDLEHQVTALERQAPDYAPGTRHGYHAMTWGWLVGALISRTSGLPVQDAVRRLLAEPLGVDGLHLGCPPEHRHRVVPCRFRYPPLRSSTLPRGAGALTRDPRAMDHPVPSIGGFFDARSLATVYALLAAEGVWESRELIRADVLRRAVSDPLPGRDGTFHVPMRWTLGYHGMRGKKSGVIEGAFGHVGFGGSAGWADPHRGLAAAFVCDRAKTLRQDRVPRLIDALGQDLEAL
ncbi:MAG: beta-lactamase family protein [Actinomycetota bacterium]|nr:beta-lactamase family protein [Actinomycetota bacterium]